LLFERVSDVASGSNGETLATDVMDSDVVSVEAGVEVEIPLSLTVSPPIASVFAEAARTVEGASVDTSPDTVILDTESVADETPREAAERIPDSDEVVESETREELLTSEAEASERELAVTDDSVMEIEAVFAISDCETLEDVESDCEEPAKTEVGSVNAVLDISPRVKSPSD
jgi:hypothetical protein